MKQRKARVALVLLLALTLGLWPTPDLDAQTVRQLYLAGTQPQPGQTYQTGPIDKQIRQSTPAPNSAGLVSVIVRLQGAPLASYMGGLPGLAATSPQATGDPRLSLTSANSQNYLRYLANQQNTVEAAVTQRIPQAQIKQRFDVVLNAVAMVVPADRVADLAQVPGVVAVLPDRLEHPNTDSSPQFIGATQIWNQLGGQESAGEGVVVGVLDTGVWPEHPSFSDPDPSGKPYAAPPPPLSGARACEFSGGAHPGPAFTCNNKLIGAKRFMATYDSLQTLDPGEFTTARDDDGHGTHTSSTAAGNASVAASIYGIPRGNISGIAPRAHVIMYKVCGAAGCFGSDSAAAIQRAILDGVNVINFSISGGSSPYSDVAELAFLDAYNAGVFVAASAGNSGPTPETTDHRGPWVTTVAASTQARAFTNKVTLTASGGATLEVNGTSLTNAVGPKSIVIPGDTFCNAPFAANSVTDKIVLCQRGSSSGRVQKGFNVLQGGAVGMVLYNQATNITDQETDNHFVPTSHIQFTDGQAVLAFITGHTSVQATITAGAPSTGQGDVMASFSSRGGPGQSLGVSKPDVTAPGVQILAGNTPQPADALILSGQLFQAIAGTSMSSPHVAGSGALLKALHPTWTPGQIKSALMTTAQTNVKKEDGVTQATPFDMGSGRIALGGAGDPGLTFAETGANLVAFQNRLWNANYPSVYLPGLPGQQTVRRTARSVLSVASQWTLTVQGAAPDVHITVPASITVAGGGTTDFNLEIDGRDVPLGQVRSATLVLASTDPGTQVVRQLHLPITFVRGTAPVTVTASCTPSSFALGATANCSATFQNTSFSPASVSGEVALARQLKIVNGSVTGGTKRGRSAIFSGTLAAASPPNVAIAPGSSPAGYQPLAGFGITPISGVGDDTITNFTTPPFLYGGQVYNSLGVSSNGYVVVGGGSGPDNTATNQSFPDATRPNNVLAPFWTDLNPGAGGAVRITVLTTNPATPPVNRWIVIDWAAVKEFSTAATDTFEIFIGVNDDDQPVEDISFDYGTINGNGDGGLLTVGAENLFGNRGQNRYLNGVGVLPSLGNALVVSTTPGSLGTPQTVTFNAIGVRTGAWTSYASATSDAFDGSQVVPFTGTVTP